MPGSRIQLELRRGDVLDGKYRVERVLGAGGMGVVVAAYHIGLRQRVAVKFLLPDALEDPEAAARFDREARAAAKIKGEHIARVMDVGTLENGSPFMVMEYLEGDDLAERLRRERRLPIEEAVQLILQTCEVLAEAHSLGIIHRDLKPANLFCVRKPDNTVSIKVLDFGISKLVGPNTSHTVTITKTSTLIGSPTYMSPEQIQSPRTVDARTDIWALGVVLYELLAGRVPFDGDSVPEICLKVAKRRVPSIRRYRSDMPAALEAVILKCLAKDREKRFSDVAELAAELAPFAAEQGRLSIDKIGQLARKAAGAVGSIFPSDKQARSRGRSEPPPVLKRQRWDITAAWKGSKAGTAAAVLGITGVALITLDLVRSKVSQPSVASAAPLASTSAAQVMTTPAAPTAVMPAASAQETGGAAPDVDCKIDFDSAPSSTLLLDGRKVGITPKLAYPTSPGEHVIVFEHPSRGRLTTSVECKGGETKAVTVRLGRGTDAPAGGGRKTIRRK